MGGGGATVTEARRTEPGSPHSPKRVMVPPLQAKAVQGKGTHATELGRDTGSQSTCLLAHTQRLGLLLAVPEAGS